MDSAPTPSLLTTWLEPSRLAKARSSYVAKTTQTLELRACLAPRIAVVDYDELVANEESLLPKLCEFVGLSYEPRLGAALHTRSVGKRDQLGADDAEYVDRFCSDVYGRALEMRTIGTAACD